MKSITVVSEDRVGLVADISYLLGKAKINIEAITVEVIAGKAIITLTIKKDTEAKGVLSNAGYSVTEPNVIMLKATDQVGEISKFTGILAKEKINIISMQTVSKDGKSAILALAVDKPKRATVLLKDYLLGQDQ